MINRVGKVFGAYLTHTDIRFLTDSCRGNQ